MTVYSDVELRKWAEAGGVVPYDPACINPASIDLRLGDQIRLPKRGSLLGRPGEDSSHLWYGPIGFSTYRLGQGQFVLCHSLEVITVPDDTVAILFSKSSAGRLGIEHLHAGYGDPGFSGQFTFELMGNGPWQVELHPGDRLMQLVLMKLTSVPEKLYAETGRYQNQRGPVPSRENRR